MKKLLSIMLSLMLFVTLIPAYGPIQTASANTGGYFSFPNESRDKASARVVSTDTITLNGTLNNIIGSSVSYKVIQVPATGPDRELSKTQDITIGVSVVGDRITITNISLQPGMNKIEFTGNRGASMEYDHIYIEYRNSPMITDLKYSYNNTGVEYEAIEDAPVLITRPTSPQSPDTLTITGKAPNAQLVELDFNGDKFQYAVTSPNDFKFFFSNLTFKQGINTATFKITTPTQELVTTRQIILYNQNPIFFEEQLVFSETTGDTKRPYQYNGEYVVTSTMNTISYEGKVILPKPFATIDATTFAADADAVRTHIQNNLQLVLGSDVKVPALADIVLTQESSDFYEFSVKIKLLDGSTAVSAAKGSTLQFNRNFQMGGNTIPSQSYSAKLLNGDAMYIADINHLPGYNSSTVTANGNHITPLAPSSTTTFTTMESTDINSQGANVFSVPFMIEVLIGQYNSTMTADNLLNALNITTGGTVLNKKILVDSAGNIVAQPVQRTVNGQQQLFTRVFVEITNLRIAGSNTVTFKFNAGSNGLSFNTDAKVYRFNLMSGPYVRFNNVVDGMNIEYTSQSRTNDAILAELGMLKGQLFNLPNKNEIVYKYSYDGNGAAVSSSSLNKRQTVFLYLNNVEIPLIAETSTDAAKFMLNGLVNGKIPVPPNSGSLSGSERELYEALNALNRGGTNVLKFTFYSNSYNFTSTYNFTIMPKDLPKVPADNSEGVYPYESNAQWPPVYNSKDYERTGTSYTTRKGTANIFGTFNLLDLATLSNTVDPDPIKDIESKLTNITGQLSDYKIVISSPEWKSNYEWKLSDNFYLVDGDLNLYGTGGTNVGNDFSNAYKINEDRVVGNQADVPAPQGAVRVLYNYEENYFYFNILNQRMPEDNSPLVFVVTVYNAGDGGPRASYRVEINPISIPYTIHSPIPENRITNANFVEVIISAPGADSMIINKQQAEKIKYISYQDSQNATLIDAFRVVVKNLRANRDTNIPFSVTRADITTSDTISVKYVPTNIPGGQYLETMKSSHKVFDGALTLAFPRNTNLIRSNYAAANDHATQVYNSHDILFSIANSTDGIVNRHLFETVIANYQVESTRDGRNIVTDQFLDYAGRYIKASQVFWIDAGLADDPATTTSYDPVTSGLDPFPFPNRQGLSQLGVAQRRAIANREIVPSKPGSLTLQYDSSIVASASATVTVFHYDPVLQRWDNIGGVVDSKKGTITVPFNKFGYYVVAKLTRGYNDITFHDYARDAMEAVYAKGVMNAINNAVQFGGDQYVTRGEFARMIVKALELPLNYGGELHFSYYQETMTNVNVPQALYDYRHIETAARAGIVNGTSPGFFDEVGQLTRQDAAVILARALELKLETDSNKAKQQVAKAFQDSGSMNVYAIPGILAMQKKGFIKGINIDPSNPKSGAVFQPQARMLRADAAIVIARVMIDQKKLAPIFF